MEYHDKAIQTLKTNEHDCQGIEWFVLFKLLLQYEHFVYVAW